MTAVEAAGFVDTGFAVLDELSEEIRACLADFRAEKKTGQLDLHFSQGAIASVEVVETFSPGNAVGSFAIAHCTRFAARKVRWFMKEKKSGRVSLLFECGDIASVKSFLRLNPGRKIKTA